MKKFSLIILFFVYVLVSCKDSSDFMDPEATTVLTEEEVFSDAQYTMQFLTGIYGRIVPVVPQTGNKGMRWPGTDAMLEVSTEHATSNLPASSAFWNVNRGMWTHATSTFSSTEWSDSWAAVRRCNMFLKYIDDVPENPEYQFYETTRSIRKGEGLFLKAFFYSEMFKQFGGLPLEDRVVGLTDEMEIPRSSVDETVDYIVALCDAAAALLPAEHPDNDYGRASKGAALALKARVLLYAASPLWNNPLKPEDSPFRGKYDAAKWEKAARAAAAVIDMGKYQLHTNIADLFVTRSNPELIFVHMNQPCAWMTHISVPRNISTTPGSRFSRSGCNQVTYNLIREYEILNNGEAYKIDDPSSGYNPQNPYVNRDPRFYRDCMFNGYIYQGRTAQFGIAEGGVETPAHNPTEDSPYYSHVYSIKFADLTINISFDGRNPGTANAQLTNQNYPYLRYAEVLLNYAEAMNEAFGPEVDGLGNGYTALWAVNQVRTRSQYPDLHEYLGQTGGMPPIPSGFSKDQMREKIRHERRIEMAFEEHRFWDIRRWRLDFEMLAEIQIQVPIWSPNGLRYEIRTLETRVFHPRTYRMPIPQLQLFNNPNLVQNPGWEMSEEEADTSL